MISNRQLPWRQMDGGIWADDLCHSGHIDHYFPVRHPSVEAYNPNGLVRQVLGSD